MGNWCGWPAGAPASWRFRTPYTEQGLLPFEQAEENLTRRYRRAQSVERIRLLRRLRAEGRTIAEVKAIVSAAGQQLSRGAEK